MSVYSRLNSAEYSDNEEDTYENHRESHLRRWVHDLLSEDLCAQDVAIALASHDILSPQELDYIKKSPISRKNDILLRLIKEKNKKCQELNAIWAKFHECVSRLQPALSDIITGDILDLLIYAMKQYHPTWLERGIIDVGVTRSFYLDDFVDPRIIVFSRQSLLRDIAIEEILNNESRVTISFKQLFMPGDDLLDPNCVRKVLLRGKQGFGKTSLCTHIVNSYSKGELWPDSILFVFFCRDLNNITHELSFFDLLMCYHGPNVRQPLWRYIMEDLMTHQHRLILMLDGLSTFTGFHQGDLPNRPRVVNPYKKCSMTDLLVNVINGTMMPKMKVLAMSRGDYLRDIFMFHRVAELGVFKDDQKLHFAHKFANGDRDLEQSVSQALCDPYLTQLLGQPTLCRFIAKHMKSLGDSTGQYQMNNMTWTKLAVHMVHHLVRYHNLLVKPAAPTSISAMLTMARPDMQRTAELALQWLLNFGDREFLTIDELDEHQIVVSQDIMSNGFLSILTTRDFKRTVHVWFINPLIRQFLAAVGLMHRLVNQPLEDYVDRLPIFRQSLLFLAGLLCEPEGRDFIHNIYPQLDINWGNAKTKVIQLTQLICQKAETPCSHDFKLYLIHLAHESQLPDVLNIVSRAIADPDGVIYIATERPSNIAVGAALRYMKKNKTTVLFEIDQNQEGGYDIDIPASEVVANPEGHIPTLQHPLEGYFTCILYELQVLLSSIPPNTDPQQPQQSAVPQIVNSAEQSDETVPKHLETSFATFTTDPRMMPEELHGKGKILAEIFAKQKCEVFHRLNKLTLFVLKQQHDLKASAQNVSMEQLDREAMEQDIIMYEPIKQCLHITPNSEIFIRSLSCYQAHH